MPDALMTPKETLEAARVLAEAVTECAESLIQRDERLAPFTLTELDCARKVLSQTPRGIADQARADSKRRNAGATEIRDGMEYTRGSDGILVSVHRDE